MKPKILVVEDNKKLAALFSEALRESFEVACVHTLKEAMSYKKEFHGVLLDLQLPDGHGLEFIGCAKKKKPGCIIIVVTAYGTIQKAVEALKLGAMDFIEKPVDLDDLISLFEMHISLDRPDEMVAVSSAMKSLRERAKQVAPTSFPVLITGETGTGKEVLARFIHKKSSRDRFLSINCANLTHELADSMLFGHLKGSFTGATEARLGLVAAADKGTLLLDEIGDLPLQTQPKLLRFLDSGQYVPIGSTIEKKSSARIITATNKDLSKAVENETFRQDLYFRLAGFILHVPPLRERPEDIIPLAEFHFKSVEKRMGFNVKISDEAQKTLLSYNYPGNVRELFNIIDQSAVLSHGRIESEQVLDLFSSEIKSDEPSFGQFWQESRDHKEKKEKELIKAALKESGGNKTAAARVLGVSYKTLLNKIKKFALMNDN